MKYFIKLLITYFTFIFINAFPQTELSQKQQQLLQQQNILINIEKKISTAQIENSKAVENLTKIEKYQKIKQLDFEKKKDSYERASKNIDLVTKERMNQLFAEYQQANEELNKANSELEEVKLKLQESNKILYQFKTDKLKIEQEIQNTKANIFDIQLREPVWAIGEAVCTLSETETPDHCKERALNDARRDATEKAGKMILESETIVKNYQLYLDEIRTYIKVQIVEQDNDPQYGCKKVIIGSDIKFVAKLRLKVQSTSNYNPFREKMAKKVIDDFKNYSEFQGTLVIRSQKGAEVFLDGRPYGEIQNGEIRITDLVPGNHTIKVLKKGHLGIIRKDFFVEQDKENTFTAKVVRKPGVELGFASILFPGLGDLIQGNYTGYLYIIAVGGSIGGHFLLNHSYKKSFDIYLNETNPDSIAKRYEDANIKYQWSKILLYTGIVIWVYDIIANFVVGISNSGTYFYRDYSYNEIDDSGRKCTLTVDPLSRSIRLTLSTTF
jgi:hypothetical protein